MPWRKDRPASEGELEFHLTGLRSLSGERIPTAHDEAWAAARADKLKRRHEPR